MDLCILPESKPGLYETALNKAKGDPSDFKLKSRIGSKKSQGKVWGTSMNRQSRPSMGSLKGRASIASANGHEVNFSDYHQELQDLSKSKARLRDLEGDLEGNRFLSCFRNERLRASGDASSPDRTAWITGSISSTCHIFQGKASSQLGPGSYNPPIRSKSGKEGALPVSHNMRAQMATAFRSYRTSDLRDKFQSLWESTHQRRSSLLEDADANPWWKSNQENSFNQLSGSAPSRPRSRVSGRLNLRGQQKFASWMGFSRLQDREQERQRDIIDVGGPQEEAGLDEDLWGGQEENWAWEQPQEVEGDSAGWESSQQDRMDEEEVRRWDQEERQRRPELDSSEGYENLEGSEEEGSLGGFWNISLDKDEQEAQPDVQKEEKEEEEESPSPQMFQIFTEDESPLSEEELSGFNIMSPSSEEVEGVGTLRLLGSQQPDISRIWTSAGGGCTLPSGAHRKHSLNVDIPPLSLPLPPFSGFHLPVQKESEGAPAEETHVSHVSFQAPPEQDTSLNAAEKEVGSSPGRVVHRLCAKGGRSRFLKSESSVSSLGSQGRDYNRISQKNEDVTSSAALHVSFFESRKKFQIQQASSKNRKVEAPIYLQPRIESVGKKALKTCKSPEKKPKKSLNSIFCSSSDPRKEQKRRESFLGLKESPFKLHKMNLEKAKKKFSSLKAHAYDLYQGLETAEEEKEGDQEVAGRFEGWKGGRERTLSHSKSVRNLGGGMQLLQEAY